MDYWGETAASFHSPAWEMTNNYQSDEAEEHRNELMNFDTAQHPAACTSLFWPPSTGSAPSIAIPFATPAPCDSNTDALGWTPAMFMGEHHYLASAFKTLSTSTSRRRPSDFSSSRRLQSGGLAASRGRRVAPSPAAEAIEDDGDDDECPKSHVVVAMIDNRAGEVGLAACDLRTASITLMQYGDNPSVSKTIMQLSIWDPTEILLAHTTLGGKLAACVAQCFMRTSTLTAVHRREFNEAKGVHRLIRLTSTPECAPDLTDTDHYLCLAAANALLRFIEDEVGVSFTDGTIRVGLQSLEDFIETDRLTARSLLMIAPLGTRKKRYRDALPSHPSPCGDASSAGEAASLADAIDMTCTAGGRRMLRANILQPPKNLSTIELRQNAVEFFLNNRQALVSLRRHLQRLQETDLEAVVAGLAHNGAAPIPGVHASESLQNRARPSIHALDRNAELKLSKLLALRHALHVILDIQEVLKRYLLPAETNSTAPLDQTADVSEPPASIMFAAHAPILLQSLYTSLVACEVLTSFVSQVDEVLDEEVVSGRAVGGDRQPEPGPGRKAARRGATSGSSFRPKSYIARRIQLAFSVKSSLDSLVDLARQRLSDALDAVHQHATELQQEHQLPSLRVHFDRQRECYLAYDQCHDVLAPPSIFLRKFQASDGARRIMCTTNTLLVLRLRLRDAVQEVVRAQEAVLQSVMEQLRSNMGKLHAACDAIALLDMLISFSTFSATRRTTRPTIVADGPLQILHAQHLVCSGGAAATTDDGGRNSIVPFSAFISPEKPVVILSGPNASGKTTVMRSIAHVCVLAHIGCSIPTTASPEAPEPAVTVRQLHRILAIAPAAAAQHASTSFTESSFFSEMRSVAFACRVVDRSTLILIDELGRGTSSADGLVVAQALVEWLSEVGCLAVYGTHMTRLTTLPAVLPRVENQHMAVVVSCVEDRAETNSTKHTSSRITPWRPSRQLKFQFQVKPGPCQIERYGIALATQLGVHPLLTQHANEILELLEQG